MRFQCTYVGADGRTSKGVLEAANEQELHEALHGRGKLLIKVSALADTPPDTGAGDSPGAASRGAHRISTPKLLAFTQAMESSLEAGVPVLSTLEAIAFQEKDTADREVFDDIAGSVRRGESVAESLEAHPRSFNELYTSLVRTGEESGNLTQTFSSLGTFIEWREGIKATAKHAAIYPAVVLSAAFGLVLFLLSFVIPRLSRILRKVTDELPLASRLLLDLSDLIANHVLAVAGGAIGLVVSIILFLRTDAGRSMIAGWLARMPLSSSIVLNLNLAQACRNLSILLASGLPLVNALLLASKSLSLEHLREGFLGVRNRVLEGMSLTESCSAEGILPPLALSMVRVGEHSGSLPLSFERLSVTYDRNAKEAVKRAVSFLEPTITIILGVIVGTVGAVIITTLYTAIGGLQK